MGSKRAESLATVPMSVKVVPSNEYAQVPRPVVPVTAMPPITAPEAESVMVVVPVPLLMKVVRLIVLAVLAVVVPKEGLAAVRTGPSVAAVTVSEAVSLAVLKAVAPPWDVVSAVPAGRAGGGVPGAVGDRGRFGVRAVRRVAEGSRLRAASRAEWSADRADVGEVRAVQRIGPGSLARRAGHGDAAHHGSCGGVGDRRRPASRC